MVDTHEGGHIQLDEALPGLDLQGNSMTASSSDQAQPHLGCLHR